MNLKSLNAQLTRISSQKVVSPESDFLKNYDIQEVFQNEITLNFEFTPEMSIASNVDDAIASNVGGSANGPESLTLDLSRFSPGKVYGLAENSMKLFQRGAPEMNAHELIPKKKAFCYLEVKLMPIDESIKSSETEGPDWFNLGKKIVVNYNIPVQLSWKGDPKNYYFRIKKNCLLVFFGHPSK